MPCTIRPGFIAGAGLVAVLAAWGCDGGDGNGPPEGALAERVCMPTDPSQRAMALSHDGLRAAYVSCEGSEGPQVWVLDLAGRNEPLPLAEANTDYSVEFLLDDTHVLYGAGGTWFIRAADASADAVSVSAGSVDELRAFVEETPSGDLEPRVVVLEREGDLRRVIVRTAADGYRVVTKLFESRGLEDGLDLLTPSGRTLIVADQDQSSRQYVKILTSQSSLDFSGFCCCETSKWRNTALLVEFCARRTTSTAAQNSPRVLSYAITPLSRDVETAKVESSVPARLSFGPGEVAMAPVSLGDVHNLGIVGGDALVRITLDNAAQIELARGSGLLAGHQQLFERTDSKGGRYAHFILDGDPARRLRDGSGPIERLATANATAQVLTPDEDTLVYLSDGKLLAVPADGGTARELISGAGAPSELVVAFAPDSSEVALLRADGTLSVASLVGSDPESRVLEPDTVVPESIGYTTDGGHLLWIAAPSGLPGSLRASALGSDDVSPVATSVTTWAPLPVSGEVVYVGEGKLIRHAL